jgi:hypothetical protein
MAEMKQYGITVKFNERGYWSKPYTYKSIVTYEKNDIVVVPTGTFYSVGKVLSCEENYQFDPKINYKHIHSKVIL